MLFWYLIVLIFSILNQLYDLQVFSLVLPLILLSIPLWLVQKVPINIGFKDILLTLVTILLSILPYSLVIIFVLNGLVIIPPLSFALHTLMVSAIPEEMFFRAYMQERLGNNYKAIIIVSVLFSLCHSARFYTTGDIEPLLTFFPSLIIGWLYMRTASLTAPILFHFVANFVYAAIT
ncbi:MAG: CPBP family intramembrane metalloprotease [Candidatus Magnetoovum sp. WYHC-5]|nr:CPBP family intramembrane metalloprotease [Candidatus Magnetoovum sp. WYHC-5]